MAAVITLFASYLIGGIPFSYIAGKSLHGIDLREHGSGNLGASNTFRILGGRVALVVLVLDIAKGFAPVAIAGTIDGGIARHWIMLAAMFGAILGHLFSPYLRFSGGKGIATSAGAFIALAPWAFLCAFGVFIVTFAARRIVSLASLSAALSLPVFVFITARAGMTIHHWSVLVVSALIMIIVILKHRSNIQRLLAGNEPALARKRG